MTDAARRWRMALGPAAYGPLPEPEGEAAKQDEVLTWLYQQSPSARGGGLGGTEPSRPEALHWLGRVRKLFPKSTCQRIEADALNRFRLADLLADPEVLARVEPSPATLRLLLSLRGSLPPALMALLRDTVRRVVDEITARLRPRIELALSGQRNRQVRGRLPRAADFDARRTLLRNLHRIDPDTGRLVPDRLFFHGRQRRSLPWQVILCVDQSGSMTDSVIHSAVMAAILSGLPGIHVRMVLFDTQVVDVSDRLTDPLETLMTVRLGGGTDIGAAMQYCAGLVDDPVRSVLVLISDFCEGGSTRRLETQVAQLVEARVRLLGLAALDDRGDPFHDHRVAARLADLGMQIGAMTPDRLAGWLAEVMT
jgi:Mg-chelatase subunit ChlD